jgi:hypothetical protein
VAAAILAESHTEQRTSVQEDLLPLIVDTKSAPMNQLYKSISCHFLVASNNLRLNLDNILPSALVSPASSANVLS